jgi:hypothetical protein
MAAVFIRAYEWRNSSLRRHVPEAYRTYVGDGSQGKPTVEFRRVLQFTLSKKNWDRGFESHLGMDVCVCSVCVFSVST